MEKVPGSREYILLFVINNAAWIVCAYTTALYIGKHNSTDNFFKRSVISFFLFFAISLLFIFLIDFDYSRLFVILIFIGFGIIILISRTLYVGAAYYLRKQYPLQRKVIVIGYNELGKKLVENFTRFNKTLSVVGYFEDEIEDENLQGYK
jgi:putative colanic acid biosynthesis UDP-glucose lipid carrier transferase